MADLIIGKEEEPIGRKRNMDGKELQYQDTNKTPEERAGLLLADLSLDEKMAQVNCIFPFGESYDDMDRISEGTPYGIGEVSTLEMRRIKTLDRKSVV